MTSMCLAHSSGDFYGSPHLHGSTENLQMMERKSQNTVNRLTWRLKSDLQRHLKDCTIHLTKIGTMKRRRRDGGLGEFPQLLSYDDVSDDDLSDV